MRRVHPDCSIRQDFPFREARRSKDFRHVGQEVRRQKRRADRAYPPGCLAEPADDVVSPGGRDGRVAHHARPDHGAVRLGRRVVLRRRVRVDDFRQAGAVGLRGSGRLLHRPAHPGVGDAQVLVPGLRLHGHLDHPGAHSRNRHVFQWFSGWFVYAGLSMQPSELTKVAFAIWGRICWPHAAWSRPACGRCWSRWYPRR